MYYISSYTFGSMDPKGKKKQKLVVVIMPHRIHETQTIVIDDPGHLSVCLSCGFAVQTLAKWIAKPGAGWPSNPWGRLGDPRNIVLYESPQFYHGFDAAFAKLLWPMLANGHLQHKQLTMYQYEIHQVCNACRQQTATKRETEIFPLIKMHITWAKIRIKCRIKNNESWDYKQSASQHIH